jgi:hypothetical protein
MDIDYFKVLDHVVASSERATKEVLLVALINEGLDETEALAVLDAYAIERNKKSG